MRCGPAPPTSSCAAATTCTPTGRSSSPCPLPDGSTWRNLTTPAKTKVAETLDEFRGQYQYNLLAENWRAFLAETAQVSQWDDHEVTNNWYPGEILEDARYAEKRVDVLAARARQAFHEYVPVARISPDPDGRVYRVIHYGPLLDLFVLDMRTHKDPNTANRETDGRRRRARGAPDTVAARRAVALAGHLEGDRRGSPDRADRAGRHGRSGGHRPGRSRSAARP